MHLIISYARKISVTDCVDFRKIILMKRKSKEAVSLFA